MCIELVFTPVRKDGLRGPPRTITSNVIVPGMFFIITYIPYGMVFFFFFEINYEITWRASICTS